MSEANHQLYLLHALTPLHVGGDEGVGGIDLPTMREAHTGYPLLPGSSLKGVLREAAEIRYKNAESDEVRGAFGPSQVESGDFRGGLVLTDANLLLLPVRSLYGTFAWVTCPPVLARLGRDLEVAGLGPLPSLPHIERNGGLVAAGEGGQARSALLVQAGPGRVFLEELAIQARPSPEAAVLASNLAAWLWPVEKDPARSFFVDRFLVVHEDVFSFYARLGLEVRSRVKIDRNTGTAAGSGPWAEEHMPAETILAGLAMGRSTKVKPKRSAEERQGKTGADEGTEWPPQKSLDILRKVVSQAPVVRFGGHSTIGLGRARVRLAGPGSSQEEARS